MIADGVRQGYAEAQIAAKVWKPVSDFTRPWSGERTKRPVVSGAAIEPWVKAMAARWPANVTVH